MIVRSLFMPVFFGSTLSAAGLTGFAFVRWGAPGAIAMFVGGVMYLLGMFAVTVVLDVPLNGRLASATS